ncbi:MAG TPA: 4Fe-4S binding protein [Dissulfurispiraceae bacterium]|nr:4Fe-4S binding protein [Dissulfurispiraceae bacterium]
MHDIYQLIAEFTGVLQQIADISRHLLPQAGVGGEIEAKPFIDLGPLMKWTLIFLFGMSTVFGFVLAFAAKKFAVKVDPRVEQVLGTLAHAHCGACGYAGCEQYAVAVVNDPKVSPSLCTPAGEKAAAKIAVITGKKAEILIPMFARVMCQGNVDLSKNRYKYEGVIDCRAAIIAGGGDKSCVYGCLGYGTCEKVCPFGAITMSTLNLPIIDEHKCTGCRKCESVCPKKVIEVLPGSKKVLVACHSKDKGPDTRKNCQVGCISCGICVKICPFEAPKVDNNLSVINVEKCRVCGLCVTKCPTKAIADFMPSRSKAAIAAEKCIGCSICAKVCPVNASAGEAKKPHAIDQVKCVGCGICTAKCPVQAISGTFNAQEVFAAAALKKARAAEKAAEAKTNA